MKSKADLLKYAIVELKRLFPNAPFLGIRSEVFEGTQVKVESLEELLDVCNKLNLLVEYYLDEDTGKVHFSTAYQGRIFVHECIVEELYDITNRLRELKESVV
ncbi:hypothetical protein PAP_05790 [Palaeococcus pacificus DY20341]|uniref:Uncharacterized protein n=1 Tax=Palaeococcus pacificus DY20341 TaxID=1343739 RepID=A0A075LY93_9EURY|nr:hypothetical protein [Palaeococcus pacificus]AIF69558.1 hypothetical protein PAP_05790 [Palaeococcus pacificus DY20341]